MKYRIIAALCVTAAGVGFLLPTPHSTSDPSPRTSPTPTVVAPVAAPVRSLPARHSSKKPTPKPTRYRVALPPLNWAALRMCESTNRPDAVSPGGTYRGLYQFDFQTWGAVGGTGDPAQASRAEQLYRAKLLYADRGRAPWPVCGAQL